MNRFLAPWWFTISGPDCIFSMFFCFRERERGENEESSLVINELSHFIFYLFNYLFIFSSVLIVILPLKCIIIC